LESIIMIDHVSIGTRELSRATAFYNACFAPLGYSVQHQDEGQVIYGANGHWSFALYPSAADAVLCGDRAHIAISAGSRQAAQGFFEAAIAGGATALREPGLRPDVNERYYGTMIKDPDGHTIEVVHWTS
jgi:catechol 2,3-dioxygenase-like lactoylglutathione lyase family enzyme